MYHLLLSPSRVTRQVTLIGSASIIQIKIFFRGSGPPFVSTSIITIAVKKGNFEAMASYSNVSRMGNDPVKPSRMAKRRPITSCMECNRRKQKARAYVSLAPGLGGYLSVQISEC